MTELDVSQMTPEQRLKQIEILLSTAAKGMNRNTEAIKSNTEAIKSNTEAIKTNAEAIGTMNLQLNRLSEIVLESTRLMAQQQAKTERVEERYQQSQAEIERIWRYLMTRSGNGNSPQ